MKMDHHIGLTSTHHGSIKTRFTHRFLYALKNLNKNKKPISYHKVKIAAYSSMASAVGSTRTWSRVMLRRIRRRQLRRASSVIFRRTIRRAKCIKNNGAKHQKNKVVSRNDEEDEGISKLRELVPGGEIMEFSSLLDESAHYIKCLNMQVQIMRNIADLLSSV
ncbi:hypothetical protein LIER_41403 [Lithospermum erythrorhizon]|uniref:IBH1-like N-terminal domain-containing protein n=1 Tax=Lithospermum erythrorhizon TaxID=34254 RepID=A0AAV3RA12_LITER